MEYRDPIPINYHQPPPHQPYQPPPPPHHQPYQPPRPPHQTYQPPPPHQTYQPPPLLYHPSSSSSVSLLPNPNPNSIPSYENPFPYPASVAAATTDNTQPPDVEPYPNPNPYAPHPPFGGPHSIAAQSYKQEASDYYYYQLRQLQQYALSSSSTAKVGSGDAIADLAIKKLRVLQCGAPADSVRICSVCNVVCNSDKVFASHLAGEKHKLKAFGSPFKGLKPKVPSHMKALHFTRTAQQLHFTRKAKQAGPKTTAEMPASKALITFVGSSVCNVCKIDCQTQEVLNNHKLGKKHVRNLQKLQESITPKPKPTPDANPGTTSGSKAENRQAKQNAAPATEEDLETKKQKVLNGGAAAGAVRVCTRCNVMCNSQEVYNSHVVGKRHLAMVNKQQQEAAPVG